MRQALARLFGIAPSEPAPDAARVPDYKAAWTEAAAGGAEDAILTGAKEDFFEFAGRTDAEIVGRYLPDAATVLDIGCGIGRVERYLAPRVRELWAVDVSGEMIRRLRSSFAPGRIKFRTAHDQSANEVQTAVLGEVASFAKKVVLLLENKDLLNPQWRKRGGHK